MQLKSSDFHIMAVDDEESIRSLLSATLSGSGYNITTASSGEDAIKQLSGEELPHIVMTDIRMPGINGIQLLSEVKKISQEIEVIIMTSHASLDTAIEAIRLGAYDYIHKPFEDIKEVIALVERTTKKIYLEQENRYLNHKIHEMAIKDGLTGLYNRRFFQETMLTEMKRANRLQDPFSILLFDVDKFKNFNDTNGHQMGDDCLKAVSKILGENSRATDFPCRYGGEEFVLIMPHTGKELAFEKAEKLRKHVESAIIPGGEKQPLGKVTISVGVSEYPYHSNTIQGLLKQADEALYHIKESGRNASRLGEPEKNHKPEFPSIDAQKQARAEKKAA